MTRADQLLTLLSSAPGVVANRVIALHMTDGMASQAGHVLRRRGYPVERVRGFGMRLRPS